MIRRNMLNELEILQVIMSSHRFSAVLPRLRDHFFIAGPHGVHLCLVLDLLSTDIGTFRLSSPTKTLALHIVQKVAGDVVQALKELHSINVIHTGLYTSPLSHLVTLTLHSTDVKPDNILFWFSQTPEMIERELVEAPLVEGHVSLAGKNYPIVRSQPIPHNWHWDDSGHTVELFRFCLNDLGQGACSISAHPLTQFYHPVCAQPNGRTSHHRQICSPHMLSARLKLSSALATTRRWTYGLLDVS